MNVNPEVSARIVAAIEELYDQLGRGDQFPTAHQVRDSARADMNACSFIFREWKRQLTARPQPVAIEVPERVSQALRESGALIWAAAIEQANFNLREAEAKWDAERSDSETMRRELAEAYEAAKAGEDSALAVLHSVKTDLSLQSQQIDTLTQQLADVRENLVRQTARAEGSELRVVELKAELTLAQSEVGNVRKELTQARVTHAAELEEHKSAAAAHIEQISETLSSTKARLASASEQLEIRQSALSESQEKTESLVQQVGIVSAQLSDLQRNHALLQEDALRSRTLAEESSCEAARLAGVLQEAQRQNAELLERLMHPSSRS